MLAKGSSNSPAACARKQPTITRRCSTRSSSAPKPSLPTTPTPAVAPSASAACAGVTPRSMRSGIWCSSTAESPMTVSEKAPAMSQKFGSRTASRAVTECSISNASPRSPPRAAYAPRAAARRGGFRITNAIGARPTPITTAPRATNACRQPRCVISVCASGTKITPPIEMPAVAKPSARPRRRRNQPATALLLGIGPSAVDPSDTQEGHQDVVVR